MIKRPRLAVFDMIGTTVKSGDEVPRAFREAFQKSGVVLTDETVTGVRGRSKQDAIADLVAIHLPAIQNPAGTCAEIYAAFRLILQNIYETASVSIPGTSTTFEYLQERDVRIVLTTGLDRVTANQILKGLGWESMGLDGLVTGDDVEKGRPAPDLIHAAMRLVAQDDPASVLVVGDTISDLEAAARARAGWSVGVLSGAHQLDNLLTCPHSVILGSVAQLPDWLEAVGAWEDD